MTLTEAPLLEASGLARRFGGRAALTDFSLRMAAGEAVALVGPNAAGKTTALRLLAARLRGDHGTLRIGGEPVTRRTRRRIGFLPQQLPLHAEMTVRQSLAWCAALYAVPAAERGAAVDRILEQLDLTTVAQRRIGNLSQGFRQRTALAQALVHDPDLVILDEPTAGLDPAQAAALRERLQTLRAGRGIVFSTHLAEDLRGGCDRVIVLRAGHRVAELASAHAQRLLWLEFTQAVDADRLRQVAGVSAVEPMRGDTAVRVELSAAADSRALLAAIVAAGWELRAWQPGDQALDLLLAGDTAAVAR